MNPSAVGSSTANDSTSVCCCEASVRPGEKGTFTSYPAFFAACSTAVLPPKTIRSASETFFLAGLRSVKLLLHRFERLQGLRQYGRLVHFPILLRCKANARPVCSTPLVGAAERRRRRPSRRDELGNGQSRREDFRLQSSNVPIPDQFMIDWRNRVLPQQLGSFGTSGPR